MDEHGKLTNVLIKDIVYTDPKTGMEINASNEITVWADDGVKETIKNIPGVTNVYTHISPTQYDVYLDPRYDKQFVKAEIEAAIMCL
jgi:hypothetical protein